MLYFLIGLLLGLNILFVYVIFTKSNFNKNKTEEQELVKREKRHYTNMMNFSLEKALGGKR